MRKEIYVIVDTTDGTFWQSATKKTSWPSVGTAKTAYGSSKNNKTRTLFDLQDRYRIARIDLNSELKAFYV